MRYTELRDKELVAMQKIIDILRPLDDDVRRRVMAAVCLVMDIRLETPIITKNFRLLFTRDAA